ncbi:cell division protein SepF [Fusibacter sp. JL216-2]|uniref:cell division protein SepF n=1 Tax=Fusibacter sp. JL216-2 TaxID=3071453 RepID=UPI003D34A10B
MSEKFVDKIKFFMGFGAYEDEDEYVEEDVVEEEKKQVTSTFTQAPAPSKVVSLHSTTSTSSTSLGSNMKVVLHQPVEFDDTRAIVDSLKNKKPVIINIEDIDAELAKKIFDFCSGALYALDGHIQKVSRGIFILAPNNVDISGDVKNELADKGIFPWSSK